VKARKIDNMFTMMLCDRNTEKKIMEAFRCNNMKVAVPTFTRREVSRPASSRRTGRISQKRIALKKAK
jgi:hypothetical protein